MKTLQLKDFLNYQFISDINYCPDGSKAAFVVKKANEAENTYDSAIWILEDGSYKKLTGLDQESQYFWEDDEHILFQAVRSTDEKKRKDKKEIFTSYYRIDIRGGEAQKAFELPFAVHKMMHIARNQYAVLADIDSKYPDHYKMSKEEKAAVAAFYEDEADYHVIDEMQYWRNGSGYVENHRTALFMVDVEAGTQERITEPYTDVTFAEVTGQKVYYLGNSFKVRRLWRQKAYCYDPLTKTDTCLYEKNEMDNLGVYSIQGKAYLLGSECKRYGMNENQYLYELDSETKEAKLVWVNEESIGSSMGSDCRLGASKVVKQVGDTLYFTTTRRTGSHFYKITPGGQEVCVIEAVGSIDDFDVNANGDVLTVSMWSGKLQEVYLTKAGEKPIQMTFINDEVVSDVYVSGYDKLTIQSQGQEIDGWVLLPKDYDPTKKYPAILDIHGGPKTAYGEIFYHEMQLWANMGYFVFFCNPFGSDGRGNEFTEVRGKYGTIDYENIMDFTDAVLAKYPQIDVARMGVTGGSYGGFMTNWIIGHTDRFAAAATQRSISNWVSFWGVSDIGPDFGTDHQLADIYDGVDDLWEHSPMKYAKNMKTPTLIIHAEEDYRCPVDQGFQIYTTLAERGIPARMCLFKGENHELSRSGKPKHRVRRLTEITNWMETYLK